MARKLDTRNSIKVVIQNSFIKARPSQNMEANAQKLLRMSIAQCRMTDKEFYEYEVSNKELAKMFNVSMADISQHIDRWTSQCMGTVLEFREQESDKFKKYTLFSKCEYDGGTLNIKLNSEMTPFVLGIKKNLGFTQYELSSILTVKSKYTIRLYELIMLKMKSQKPYAENTIEVEISIDEVRTQTSTENRYKQIGQLKEKVINKAFEEIEKKMFWKIEVTDIKRGRTIIGMKLKIWSKNGFNYMEMQKKKKYVN